MSYEFRFIGGWRDGAVVRSYSLEADERDEAIRLLSDFSGGHEGITRPLFTPEAQGVLRRGKTKDIARITQFVHLYQVVNRCLQEGVQVINCRQVADREEEPEQR